ncbi:MAG: hypothetical protein Q4F60_02210 [Candidatus Saccharibacteria bacterium]|nr:hypothetical protein [Candidatus Saccharibacteria bacterium]
MSSDNPYASTPDEAKTYAEGHSAVPLQGPTGELLNEGRDLGAAMDAETRGETMRAGDNTQPLMGTGVSLESPIVSPTVFDNRDNPHPIHPAPVKPVPKAALPKPATAPKTPKDHSKALSTLSIFLGIVAIVGIALGVVGITMASSAKNKLEIANEDTKKANAIIAQIENETGTKINTVADVPTFKSSKGYLYLNDWTIKFKIPEKLDRVSYVYDSDGNYHSKICVTGIQKGDTSAFPAFADIEQNHNGVGCLTRISTTEGSSDSEGNSFGTLVHTEGDYNYFYTQPEIFSTDPAEASLEQNAERIVKTMLEDISSYK